MNIRDFHEIQCTPCLTDMVNPELHTKFLYGGRMIDQKETKNLGQEVSWYEVIKTDNKGNFEYITRYGRLTNENGGKE